MKVSATNYGITDSAMINVDGLYCLTYLSCSLGWKATFVETPFF